MSLGIDTGAPWYAGQRLTSDDRLEALASALGAVECMADLNDLMQRPACRSALRIPAAAWMIHVRFTELTAPRRQQPRDGGSVASWSWS